MGQDALAGEAATGGAPRTPYDFWVFGVRPFFSEGAAATVFGFSFLGFFASLFPRT